MILEICLALTFGILFFLIDSYHEYFRIHDSIIAGISISYFFLVVLVEISQGLPEYPLHLESFEYFFIILGFTFIHVSEKFILQKVESNSQKKIRDLVKMEKNLEMVENNLHDIIMEQLNELKIDVDALKEINQTMIQLKSQENFLKSQIEDMKMKISKHLIKDLDELRFITSYIYHFLIGIIIIGLLMVELLSGIFFFIFAFFMTIIKKRSDKQIIFSDLDIEIEYHDIGRKQFILASSAITGVFIGIIVDIAFGLQLEVLYLLYSFISGVILYTIVRKVIPEKEKGNPYYFILGFILFSLILLLIKYFQHNLDI